MEQICKNAPKQLCLSLQIISCCEFYQNENETETENETENESENETENENKSENVNVNSWNNYCYIRSNRKFKKYNSDSIGEVIYNENVIQLLHDLSIQIRHLQFSNLTFTDVEGDDILEVEGRYCIINTNKLVVFNKKTQYADFTYPISFGPFIANELSNINKIPTVNAIHKNSIIWSIGRMIVEYLFDEPDNDEKDKWSIMLNQMDQSGIIPILIRCLNPEPEKRMLLIF